jgi:hypothetical protein
MSADGKWKITVQTPMGAQEVTADITTDGGAFTARTEGAMGGQEVSGTVLGDTLAWSTDITSPMPLHIEFEAKVEGDRMSGSAKLGMFGSAPLTGERI